MKIRANPEDPGLIYIRAEDDDEQKILSEIWKRGIRVFCGGAELGICVEDTKKTQWKGTKKRLKYLEEEPDNPLGSAVPSKDLLDHALFAKALRLIMEKLEAS